MSQGWCAGDVGDGSVQPCDSQSSAEINVDEDSSCPSRHRRVLRLDGRSSSETSGASATDAVAVDPGRTPAVRRGSSVDDAMRPAGHNRHVSFILSSGDVRGADAITSSMGRQSFDGVSFPSSNRSLFFTVVIRGKY